MTISPPTPERLRLYADWLLRFLTSFGPKTSDKGGWMRNLLSVFHCHIMRKQKSSM